MGKFLISFLLVSLNVLYAFESHSSENLVPHSSDLSITAEFHHEGPCSEGNHGEVPANEHACHLGQCSFIVSAYLIPFEVLKIQQVSSNPLGVVSPFIDEEIRPPIFS